MQSSLSCMSHLPPSYSCANLETLLSLIIALVASIGALLIVLKGGLYQNINEFDHTHAFPQNGDKLFKGGVVDVVTIDPVNYA